ncbi:MAG: SH3 domain-containing protein [Jatrophihabitans sp.]
MNKPIALAVSAVVVAASLVGLSAGNASANAACGSRAPADIDHSAYVTPLANANIRTGSGLSCTAVGVLTTVQKADYYCYTVGYTTPYTWTYLRDVTTGKTGWVRDDNLRGDGSLVPC